MRGKRTKRTRSRLDWAAKFLSLIADGATIKAACEGANIGRTKVYERRDNDETFRIALEEAIEASTEDLEEVARKRAKQKSDPLMMFLLRARRPDVYRENVNHSGSVRVRLAVAAAELSDDELAEIAAKAQQSDEPTGGGRTTAAPPSPP